jgi:hypothetical protein
MLREARMTTLSIIWSCASFALFVKQLIQKRLKSLNAFVKGDALGRNAFDVVECQYVIEWRNIAPRPEPLPKDHFPHRRPNAVNRLISLGVNLAR